MKKNLLLRLCLMMSVILALNSCISDDLSSQENPTQDASSFQIFSNRNSQHTQRGSSGSLYYQEAFRDLYFSYYRDHPEEAPDVKDPESFYIDFSRASQVLMGEDSTRYVIFPFMKGLEVKYVVACSVSSKHDYVSFYFPEENEIVKNAIAAFSLMSERNTISQRTRCGYEGEPPCEIEEVSIKVPPRAIPSITPGTPYGLDPGYPFPPSGGCGTYNNCGGGGSSSPPITPPPTTPCDKAKLISNSTINKDLFNILKGLTTSSGAENAYTINPDGTYDYHPGITSGIGTGELSLSFNGPVNAVLHSHYSGLFSTFSVSDVFAIASMYKQGVISNTNTFVFGVVTASGTQYLLVIDDLQKFGNFTSSAVDFNGMLNSEFFRQYESMYKNLGISTLNTIQNNESLFTKFLEMTNTGMKMVKGSSDFSNWSTLNLNYNDEAIPQQCN